MDYLTGLNDLADEEEGEDEMQELSPMEQGTKPQQTDD